MPNYYRKQRSVLGLWTIWTMSLEASLANVPTAEHKATFGLQIGKDFPIKPDSPSRLSTPSRLVPRGLRQVATPVWRAAGSPHFRGLEQATTGRSAAGSSRDGNARSKALGKSNGNGRRLLRAILGKASIDATSPPPLLAAPRLCFCIQAMPFDPLPFDHSPCLSWSLPAPLRYHCGTSAFV